MVRKCRLVQLVGGTLIVTEIKPDCIEPAMSVRGYDLVEFTGHIADHEELEGAPIFDGLHGPMYDGPGVIRYETPEAHARLSH